MAKIYIWLIITFSWTQTVGDIDVSDPDIACPQICRMVTSAAAGVCHPPAPSLE